MTKTFKEVIAGIRTAIYGREVREDIAQMGEYVEQFSNTATTKASEAASSATAAKNSQTAAKTSETNSAASQKAAASSASAAASSASAAKTSETNAAKSQQAAASSASAAASSASAAKSSETAAAGSAFAAKQSEENSASSAAAAKESQNAAATSEKNAADSKAAAEQALKDTQQAKTDALTDISAAHGTVLSDISTAEETALSNVADATKTSTANAATATQKAADAAQSAADALAHQQAAATSEGNAADSAEAAKASEERAAELASERVAWDNISGKPSTYPPSSHKHTKAEITDFPSSMPASDVPAWAKAQTKPSYAWGEITGKPSTFTPASHTHDDRYYTETEMNTKLGEKQNIRNGTKSDAINWNTLTTAGAYKIQNCTMTAAYNAPVGEYPYGILEVIDGEGNTGEYRLLQIYHPHNTSGIWYRMNNAPGGYTSWTSWVKIAVKPATAGTADVANSVAWGNVTGKPSTFAPASHTHNYAGSGSAGGSANSAVKLDSSAGSATQPVYFSGGKPVACSYTLGKSVPSNAVFTDTNTWRGVQNNLTSTATDQSLSAAMGKWLNENKAASSHTHSAGTTGAFSGVQASGSNYVRFTDGTQICWVRTAGTSDSGNVGVRWNFPAAFVDSNSYSVVYSGFGQLTWSTSYVQAASASYADLYIRKLIYFVIAIGRWK